MPRKLALVIGNSQYDDPTLSRLKAPEADVGALADLLRAPDIGGFEQVETLVNRPFAEVHPALAAFFADKRPDDLLLLYFSGHGVLDAQGRLYLGLKNTQRTLLSGTAIASTFVKDEMDSSRSRRQVLILDCCHSGAFARGGKGALGAQAVTNATFEGHGRVVLTATDTTQYAWEGDQIIGETDNSLFTHFVIEGLKTGAADTDGDGHITPDELYEFVFGRIVSATSKQKPRKIVYDQQGELIIALNPYRPQPKPAGLPTELRQAIESPLAGVRAGAVEELSRLLRGSRPELAQAAHEALAKLNDDDSLRVRAAAAEALTGHSDLPPPHEAARPAADRPAFSLPQSRDLQTVLNEVMDTVTRLTGAERCILLLKDDQGELQVSLTRNADRELLMGDAFAPSRMVIGQVAAKGEAMVTSNAQADPRFASQASVLSYNLRSITAAPLKVQGVVTGVIYVDSRIRTGLFSEQAGRQLASYAEAVAPIIEAARREGMRVGVEDELAPIGKRTITVPAAPVRARAGPGDPLVGRKFGPYILDEFLGRGGMTLVYRGRQETLDRVVVVKILPADLMRDPNFGVRFMTEARTLAKLNHPAILPVYDFGEVDGAPYLVVPYMANGTLRERLKPGGLAISETVRIVKALANALDFAHKSGILHRDVTPGNIFFDKNDNPYLADFGLAKAFQSSAGHFTAAGIGIIGTPDYMSPEQARGDAFGIDHLSDIYMLGIVTYECLTGTVPFGGDTPVAVLLRHIKEAPPPLRQARPEIPEKVEQAVLRALAKSPEARFGSAGEFAQALSAGAGPA